MNTRSPHRRVAPLTVLCLVVAVIAISTSAPLITFAAVPALAVAFWRNGLATAALTPVAVVTRRDEVRAMTRTDVFFCVFAGIALAAHFGTWVPSVKIGTVATATAFVATQPVWQGLIAAAQGRRPNAAGWIGIVLAVVGVAWAAGAGVGSSGRALLSDVLALLGAIFAAVYTALGERARATVSTTTYTWICYGTCAVVLLTVCLIGGVHLSGYTGVAWLALLGMVVGPQLLGHSMFNYALQHTSATTVSVLILLEVPGAALIAWIWLDQRPQAAVIPGLLVLLAGVATVVLGGRTRTPALAD